MWKLSKVRFYLRHNCMPQSVTSKQSEKLTISFLLLLLNFYFLFNYLIYFLGLISIFLFVLIFYKLELIWFARWSWTFRSVTNLRPLRIFQIMQNDHIKEKLIFRIRNTQSICHYGLCLSESGFQSVNHRANCYFLDPGLKTLPGIQHFWSC